MKLCIKRCSKTKHLKALRRRLPRKEVHIPQGSGEAILAASDGEKGMATAVV
jgi:hypothetical protein